MNCKAALALLMVIAADSTAANAPTVSSIVGANVSPPPAFTWPASGNAAPEMADTANQWVRIKDHGYFLLAAKWPTNFIPVCWEIDANSYQLERTVVQKAVAASWQANSSVVFGGWGTCAVNARGIRIVVRDDGSNDGPHTQGLGKQLDGVKNGMVLNFTFKTWSQPCLSDENMRMSCITSIAVHEFGHAIGFAHEQNRWDKPGECKEKPQGGNGDTFLTPYDPESVMNYCNPVYNNLGILSACDVQGVRAVYHPLQNQFLPPAGICQAAGP